MERIDQEQKRVAESSDYSEEVSAEKKVPDRKTRKEK